MNEQPKEEPFTPTHEDLIAVLERCIRWIYQNSEDPDQTPWKDATRIFENYTQPPTTLTEAPYNSLINAIYLSYEMPYISESVYKKAQQLVNDWAHRNGIKTPNN